MKRWIMICLCVLFLCSCRKSIEVSFEKQKETLIYAIEQDTNEIKQVSIDYNLTNDLELFYLYTIYQNCLPIGFVSPANPNVTLLSSVVKNHIVYYTVDNFILLSDIPKLHEVLVKTGKTLNYREIHIILNDNEFI